MHKPGRDRELSYAPAESTKQGPDIGQPRAVAVGRQGLIDGYREGEVGIEVWGALGSAEVEPRYWRAVFERFSRKAIGGVRIALIGAPIDAVHVQHLDSQQQQSMLVPIVHQPEPPEGVHVDPAAVVHSVVWLRFFKRREDLRVFDWRAEVDPSQIALLVKGRVVDRELSLFPGLATVEQHKLPCEMIESGPEVEQHLSNHDRPFRVDRRELLDC